MRPEKESRHSQRSGKAALHPPSSGGALFILEMGNVRSKKQPGIDLGEAICGDYPVKRYWTEDAGAGRECVTGKKL